MEDVTNMTTVSIPAAPKPEIVSLPMAAELCEKEGIGLSYGRLLRLLRARKIPSFRSGNRFYLSMAALREAIRDTNSPLWAE